MAPLEAIPLRPPDPLEHEQDGFVLSVADADVSLPSLPQTTS